jgi:hypothetical protein
MRNGKVAARPSGFPDCLKAPDGTGEEEEKLMTWLKGLPGAQAPFGAFCQTQSNLVKLPLMNFQIRRSTPLFGLAAPR